MLSLPVIATILVVIFVPLLVGFILKKRKTAKSRDICQRIYANVIGEGALFEGPFGKRAITYCDYIASGKPLRFIENFIRENVLIYYANTHTSTSYTGAQSTNYREESRAIIKRCCNCNENDILVFEGSGATACVSKLVHQLGLRYDQKKTDCNYFHAPETGHSISDKPHLWSCVVVVGPYEHHSNILPWREIENSFVIECEMDGEGKVDYENLEKILKKYAQICDQVEKDHSKRIVRIGTFSAGSNVTGTRPRINKITYLLHKYNFLSFWDYACVAPYVPIDMNPIAPDYDEYSENSDKKISIQKDALFFSAHKIVGGPSAPGILILKKECLKNYSPVRPGGGSVAFVTSHDHLYLKDPTHREEAGTPEIIGAIRAGLAFQLKEKITEKTIEEKEQAFVKSAFLRLSNNKNIAFLGNLSLPRVAILTFMVKHNGFALHHSFISALFNDLFGIQTRSGCACAGPYGAHLLGLTPEEVQEIENVIRTAENSESMNFELFKPGFCRLSFNYFIPQHVFEFIVSAVEFVASEGYKFLPYYHYDPKLDAWVAHKFIREFGSLKDITYDNKVTNCKKQNCCEFFVDKARAEKTYNEYFEIAKKSAETIVDLVKNEKLKVGKEVFAEETNLRWFLAPSEILEEIRSGKSFSGNLRRINPKKYPFQEQMYQNEMKNLDNVF